MIAVRYTYRPVGGPIPLHRYRKRSKSARVISTPWAPGRLHHRIGEQHGSRHRGRNGFYVMYGQTEAAPRMTTLPSERLADKDLGWGDDQTGSLHPSGTP